MDQILASGYSLPICKIETLLKGKLQTEKEYVKDSPEGAFRKALEIFFLNFVTVKDKVNNYFT